MRCRDWFCLFIFFSLFQCNAPSATLNISRPPHNLTQIEAAFRAKHVSDLRYDLKLDLDATKENFAGEIEIRFLWNGSSSDLFLDFYGGKIATLLVNDQKTSPRYDGARILLDAKILRSGENTVRIAYSHPYSTDGSGLYRFEDPEDGRIYLYTDFEPYNANLVFPCFDQPDLKAKFSVSVVTPEKWRVISAAPEESVTPASGGRTLHQFLTTPRISTYVFSIVAGEYHEWQGAAGKIPLRLFARESIAKHVDSEAWFDVTKSGLKFYQDYFDYDYPFKKYDQIIVPDFNAEAMENLAAVTVSEMYVYRARPTRDQEIDRADTILHEMAHMWFGNLVTMKWWNGLWLNESFASLLSTIAMEQATPFKTSWQAFFEVWQRPALIEDQLITTHPVEVAVASTSEAFSNFDNITYGKGAAAFKALRAFLGDATFRKGLRAYFKSFAFANAELDDLITALGAAGKTDLSAWSAEWLLTKGPNTVQADWHCDKERLSAFTLRQSASPKAPTLRTHHAAVGLYQVSENSVTLYKVVPVTYSGEATTVTALIGAACPDLVNPNYDDIDYVNVKLDDVTLQNARSNLSRIPEPLTRHVFWHALWQSVRDAELSPQDYADLVLKQAGEEKDFLILKPTVAALYEPLSSTLPSLLAYLPGNESGGASLCDTYRGKFAKTFWQLYESAPKDSDERRFFWDSYVSTAEDEMAQTRFRAALSGAENALGFFLDQDRRWSLVVALNAIGAAGGKTLAQDELKRDSSHDGKTAAIIAEVVRPDSRVKEKWFAEIVNPDSAKSQGDLVAAMTGLFPLRQIRLKADFVDEFYAALPHLQSKNDEFLEEYVTHLYPMLCSADNADRLKDFLARHPNLPPIVIKNLRIQEDEERRCLRISLAPKIAFSYAPRHAPN